MLWFEKLFSNWADIVARRPLIVFLVSLFVFGALSKLKDHFACMHDYLYNDDD